MILITGGSGFVGRRVARALVAGGASLTALTRGDDRRHLLPAGTRIVVGDITDPAAVNRALEGVDTVIHLAASLPGTADATSAFSRDVEGTRLMAKVSRACGVHTFIHMSSAGVYGGSTAAAAAEDAPLAAQSPYERAKLESEKAVLSELSGGDTRWVILRPPGIYGPGRPQTLEFLRDVWRKPVWLHGATRVIVHPTHVDDVVAAIASLLARDDVRDEVFNVGGERSIVYQGLIALAGRLLSCRVFQISLPVIGRAVNRSVDCTKALARLDLHPRSLADGMAECIESFRAERLL